MRFADLYTRWRSRSALSSFQAQVARMGALEPELKTLSDSQLRDRFQALATRPIAERMVPGFALVREASRRTLGLRQFDVQLIGGLVLAAGKLAEMRTGEGKTLTIVAPASVLALDGKGVHVVTSNDYLAQRDAEAMRPVYELLGLSVQALRPEQSVAEKQAAYGAHITYGVGHEFGFDYLRDNMARDTGSVVQRALHAAIVDEIDSILIDEARVPLIMSGRDTDVVDVVSRIDRVVRTLQAGSDFEVRLKERDAALTEHGYARAERGLVEQGLVESSADLYAPRNLWVARRLHAAVRAYALYRRDRDYVVEGGALVLVDTGTGRKMHGRRMQDGLHEALEAREGLPVMPGSLTRASVSYQNFFSLYGTLSGLTGTALTEADEFSEIYGLETVVVPTNRPIQRVEAEDLVFLTKAAKFEAAIERVCERHAAGQPVLLGCATIRDAEVLDALLTKNGLAHEMLTAKHIEREAHVIAQAGRPGAITVATNMAGRGTDIMLGGEKPSPEHFESKDAFEEALATWSQARERVLEAGGLYVLGTERNGIRRVDNQLAGRSGRQGDPGQVQFFMSLEDELLKVFGLSKQLTMVRELAQRSGGALGGASIRSLVISSQRRVEGQGFDARRELMKYDKPLADQRLAVYGLRRTLLEHPEAVEAFVQSSVRDAVQGWLERTVDIALMPEQWDAAALKKGLLTQFGLNVPVLRWVTKDELEGPAIVARIHEAAQALLAESTLDLDQRKEAVFAALDEQWTAHLTALDELRQSVSLKGHTGLNPLFQFGKDAFDLFKDFEFEVSLDVASRVLPTPAAKERTASEQALTLARQAEQRVAEALDARWVLRNDACPCGSGKKFKFCHGKLA